MGHWQTPRRGPEQVIGAGHGGKRSPQRISAFAGAPVALEAVGTDDARGRGAVASLLGALVGSVTLVGLGALVALEIDEAPGLGGRGSALLPLAPEALSGVCLAAGASQAIPSTTNPIKTTSNDQRKRRMARA